MKSLTERDRIVQELIKLRVEKFASTKTLLEYLYTQYGYEQSYSYELVRLSRQEITKIFAEELEESFNNAVAQLDEIIETTKNEKQRIEAIKEKNKVLGVYRPQRVDITTKGQSITDITVEIIYNKEKED